MIKTSELEIDKFGLDDAAATQPMLYMRCVEAYSDAKEELSKAERKLSFVISELDLSIRRYPDNYGLAEIKEAAVKAIINNDQQVQNLMDKVAKLKSAARRLLGMKEAADQRKQMIKTLGELYIGEYFSSVEIKKATTLNMRRQLGKKNNNTRR